VEFDSLALTDARDSDYSRFDPEYRFNGNWLDAKGAIERAMALATRPIITPEIAALRELRYRAEYLATPHWRAVRRRALARAGGFCQGCRERKPPLDVHHLTYVRLGCEADADLMVLCRPCHEKEHGEAS
jgi:5-methylcytosine-specific restriction endonuclease McrA